MHTSRLFPPGAARALSRMLLRVKGTFEGTPVLFFAVVVGVALTFRVAVGWARATPPPEDRAPHFTTTPRTEPVETAAIAPVAPRTSAPVARPAAVQPASPGIAPAPAKPAKKRKTPAHAHQ